MFSSIAFYFKAVQTVDVFETLKWMWYIKDSVSYRGIVNGTLHKNVSVLTHGHNIGWCFKSKSDIMSAAQWSAVNLRTLTK